MSRSERKAGLQLYRPTCLSAVRRARTDEGRIRAAAVARNVSCITTMQAIQAVVKALEALREEDLSVRALQDRLASARL